MTQLIKSVGETGQWLKECTEVTAIALKKKLNATKYSKQYNQYHGIYSKDNREDN